MAAPRFVILLFTIKMALKWRMAYSGRMESAKKPIPTQLEGHGPIGKDFEKGLSTVHTALFN